MKFEDVFLKYLLNPEDYWPSTHFRNAKKVRKFIEKGRVLRGESEKQYIYNILNLTYLRKGIGPRHLYLVNAGGSGSHWLEAMLSLLPKFYNGGEIYLPKKIKEALSAMSQDEAEMFLDSVYVLHSGGIYADSLSAVISNSAHLANHESISKYSRCKKIVLLLRNPVDIVMSRTFRKDDYKSDIAPSLSDKEYLESNCLYLERFYNNLNFESFDKVVRYEEFVASPKENLKSLADIISIDVSESHIVNAVFKTSRDEEAKVAKRGGSTMTNIYFSQKREQSWARDYIKERLSHVIAESGY